MNNGRYKQLIPHISVSKKGTYKQLFTQITVSIKNGRYEQLFLYTIDDTNNCFHKQLKVQKIHKQLKI